MKKSRIRRALPRPSYRGDLWGWRPDTAGAGARPRTAPWRVRRKSIHREWVRLTILRTLQNAALAPDMRSLRSVAVMQFRSEQLTVPPIARSKVSYCTPQPHRAYGTADRVVPIAFEIPRYSARAVRSAPVSRERSVRSPSVLRSESGHEVVRLDSFDFECAVTPLVRNHAHQCT
jgi:hypothetical protein